MRLELKNNGGLKQRSTIRDPRSSNFVGKTNAKREMELVKRMPVIIEQLKNRELGRIDLKRISKTYGDLWPLMIEEASRRPNVRMNPIIEILLNAAEIHNNKADGESKKVGNDIDHNTINLRKYLLSHRGRIPLRLLKLRMKTSLTPSQRLLKVAAILIRDSINMTKTNKKSSRRSNLKAQQRRNNENTKKLAKTQDVSAETIDNIDSTEKLIVFPEVKSYRMKRGAPSPQNDEIGLNALKSFIENQSDDDHLNDADNTEYDYDDQPTRRTGSSAGTQHEEQQIMRQEEQKQQSSFIDSEDYHDYAFDTTDTDQFNEEDDMLRKFYGHHRRAAYEDYDSFSDLMHLAAANDRRDTRFLSRLHFDYLNDDDINKGSDDSDYNEFDYET